ncbi:MAG: flagellar filament capping protein FliD [Desulfatiglans sp.]|nr:flagellar filament capping protein FliD [Desulfatiglans sp.]
MAISTNLISGLSSGFDWRSMIDQLIALDSKPIQNQEAQKTKYEGQLAEWRSFNTTLLSLKSAASNLSDPDDFNVFSASMTSDSSTVDAEDLLSISTTSNASAGSYSILVKNVAVAQKLSSSSFNSFSDALGSDYAGDIVINGRVISINETDGLDDVRNRINNANSGTNPTGVTASIISYGSNDYRLILTSNITGESGISLQNGSGNNLLERIGWKDNSVSLKNSITGGAMSDSFTSTTQDIKSILGLSSTQSGTVQIGGHEVAIDLSVDSLEDIKSRINEFSNISASIVTKTESGVTKYVLQINGTQDFTDSNNILETMGVLEKGASDSQGTTSANSMTTSGDAITADTVLSSIDGYYSWTSDDSVSISGTDHSGNTINTSFSITASSTVKDLLDSVKDAFESNGDNVNIYITSDGKIEVEDLETGTSSLAVSLNSTISDGALSLGAFSALSTVRKREIVTGEDALISIDGVDVKSSDNTINNVLNGVTLNLKASDELTTITLNIDRDISGIVDKIKTFVDSYNSVSSYIAKQQSYDTEKEKTGGVLFGDGTLSSVKSDLSSLLINPIWGVSSQFSILGLVGINLNNEGQLSLDSAKLNDFLKTNFYDIQQLFTATGTSNAGTMEFVSSSKDTQAGEYVINITQAATKNSSISNSAIIGALGSDEILTVKDGDKTAVISLTAGMTLPDIVNAANTEFDTVYTETLVGNTSVTASASPVTFSTTWSSIDGANMVNGDIINFSGTTRNGSEVSGSYTIDETTTDTIQGLLSEIESMLGNVSVTIDGNGRLKIIDGSEGTSSLSFALDYSQTTNQVDIFGAVLTSNSGGHEGRYAMSITASNDGTNHLKLTSDNYGSNSSFTIEETTDAGLWTGSMATPVTVNNGLDVAGTINGRSATGSGQKLTGDKGEENISGLAIKYTGASTGEIGKIKLTLGIAELFDRTLFSITDTYQGYVGFKQSSLSDRIKNIDDTMDTMQARLDHKMEAMINRFVMMESALSKIQNMSSWLSGQLSAASSGWAW